MNAFLKPAIIPLNPKQISLIWVAEPTNLAKLIVVELKLGPWGGAKTVAASHTDQNRHHTENGTGTVKKRKK